MDARKLTHAERINEWEKQIRLCRSSGMTVTHWCETNGINPKTYYKWERVCLKEAAERLGYTDTKTGMIKVDPNALPEVTSGIPLPMPEEKMVLHFEQVSIAFHSEIPVSKIADLVCALNSHV